MTVPAVLRICRSQAKHGSPGAPKAAQIPLPDFRPL